MQQSLGIIWDFRFQPSAGRKVAAEHAKTVQSQNWADIRKQAII